MEGGYLTNQVRDLLSEHGELSERCIAETLGKPVGNISVLLRCRKCFGQNPFTKRWGLRDESEKLL